MLFVYENIDTVINALTYCSGSRAFSTSDTERGLVIYSLEYSMLGFVRFLTSVLPLLFGAVRTTTK